MQKKEIDALTLRLKKTQDDARSNLIEKRLKKNFLSSRQNLINLVDKNTFVEYGQLVVAAQKDRINPSEIVEKTAADGVLTGFGKVNSHLFNKESCKVALIINDFTVLAGTQGYFHHKKIDRIIKKATLENIPIIIFTEGGGGRPGDTDVKINNSWLDFDTFEIWAADECPLKIAITNGYCFAGNAALFGCADFKIATEESWIGMAGPSMIEGAGLGTFDPKEIGPCAIQSKNGLIDIVVKNEYEASKISKQLIAFFQGSIKESITVANQNVISRILPNDRKRVYDIKKIINIVFDKNSFLELKKDFGKSIIIGFARINGIPISLVASNCMHLSGAIDADAADKITDFYSILNKLNLPLIILGDTPGFMVGPESEKRNTVKKNSDLFKKSSSLKIPMICVILRKAYGLGIQSLVGGSFKKPMYICAWPGAEFGAMGNEGAVKLGFKKEIESIKSNFEKEKFIKEKVEEIYNKGSAIEIATNFEIDEVIMPNQTRDKIVKLLM